MPAFTLPFVDLAPANMASIACTGFTPGAATVTLSKQGAAQATVVTIPAQIASGTGGAQTLAFLVPDGLRTDTATVTDSQSASAAIGMRARSQYVQAAEFIGTGMLTVDLAPGELDNILRRASSWADAHMGGTKRQFQWLERHKYRKSRRIFPYHRPIVSVDELQFISAPQIVTTFNVATDLYLNNQGGYIEILSYALGQYALLGALEVIGFSANVLQLTVTCGYSALEYPDRLREATVLLAAELLTNRQMNAAGMAFLERDGDPEMTRRRVPFSMPAPAAGLLRPFQSVGLR